MSAEVFSIRSDDGLRYLKEIKPEIGQNIGQYLRVKEEVWLGQLNLSFRGPEMLDALGLDRHFFLKLFELAESDSRAFVYFDPEMYNFYLRKKSFSTGERIYPSMLLDHPRIKLCGASDLWKWNNSVALKKSVQLFSELFPQFQITSGPTVWDELDGQFR